MATNQNKSDMNNYGNAAFESAGSRMNETEKIRNIRANLVHARNMGNTEQIVFLEDMLERLLAPSCRACKSVHTGWDCPNTHGSGE